MKASELISKLQQLVEEHGDREVEAFTVCCNSHSEAVSEIEVRSFDDAAKSVGCKDHFYLRAGE